VIAFSPGYLLDGVVAATAGAEDGRVRLRFTSASKPAVITQSPSGAPGGPGNDFRYLVVPQRVQQ
jgi:DNA polymerase III sliding clamp (beta) subunit (PCNA family)